MPELLWPATAMLVLFIGIGAYDGLYLHLWRFRLFARPESRREHLTHTLRALLVLPTIVLLFIVNSQGWLLYLALGLALLDFAVMIWDVLTEEGSRADFGGLPQGEYLIHLVGTTLHVTALTLAFASRPMQAWLPSASVVGPAPVPEIISTTAWAVLPGAALVGLLHVILLHPAFLAYNPKESRPEATAASQAVAAGN